MKRFLKILKYTGLSILIILVVLSADVVYENIVVNAQIEEFMDNGVYVGNYGDLFLYEVKIDEELSETSITFNEQGIPTSTNPGDIFLYRESTLDENYPAIPFLKQFVSYYFGGHAGVIVDENFTVETNGAYSDAGKNIVDNCENNIFSSPSQRDTLGLRVNAPQEDIDASLTYLEEAVGMPYNYTFIFNKANSYYCTDLVARAFGKEAGLSYELDKDGIATSCNDLIISEDTYIIYYMFYNDGERHLYYAV